MEIDKVVSSTSLLHGNAHACLYLIPQAHDSPHPTPAPHKMQQPTCSLCCDYLGTFLDTQESWGSSSASPF